jgi:hypothetical protein
VNTRNLQVVTYTKILLVLALIFAFASTTVAQRGANPLNISKNYFVTGDYVVAGWLESSSDGTYATGTISVPDPKQEPYLQPGIVTSVPVGADIVAAYLYWATVEGSQSTFAGQQAFFNGYAITGDVLGNPNAPTSWSAGGCSGSSSGSKTMRTYRADVRPYFPIDNNVNSPTFGGYLPNSTFTVKLADSGSNGRTQPFALGASLVIIYRVLNPPTPLNAVVIYDGAYAPSNAGQNMSQAISGFYQPNLNPTAKITHIVANGKPNKGENLYFGASNNLLPPLYTSIFGANSPPFPGVYGTWDNPSWLVGNFMTGGVSGFDTSETTSVTPSPTNSGCVSWGAIIMSSTVQDSDGDGLLDTWESNQGYTDAVSGNFVALPGSDPLKKDIFVELDYLTDLDGSPNQHSHLPKQAALDGVGNAFSTQGINIHFDAGSVYQNGDNYIVTNGTGGNAIPESALSCSDGAALCAFPGQPAVAWKGGFGFVRDNATMPNTNPPAPLGNFQAGRGQSYHYVLSAHSLGEPISFWSTYLADLGNPGLPQLLSIVNSGTTATVTIQTPVVLSPKGVTVIPKPGDCPNASIPDCSDANSGRVTITGALTAPFVPGTNPQPAPPLNGTYTFSNASSSNSVVNGVAVTTTTFTITTSGVANGTYNFNNEPQLGVAYLGPTGSSGHSDFGGGGDSVITFGLWGADDPAGCQPDPSQSLAPGQVYCNNQVGTTAQQTGTLLHEIGHSLTLTHGGTYYNDPINLSLPTYEINCKPNFISVMNYMFQVRGFVDGGFDYSGQTLPALNEAYPFLSESLGVGKDIFTGATAAHLTRWYSVPNALDTQLQNTTGGRYAKSHCDGSALTSADVPGVRVDGTVAPIGNFSAPLDWNNDQVVPDAIVAPGIDLNYNGLLGDPQFSGFNDWQAVNGVALQQIAARGSAYGFSGGGLKPGPNGGLKPGPNGGVDNDGGSGLKPGPNGGLKPGPNGGVKPGNNIGTDVDEATATSTADPPTALACSDCVNSQENNKNVPLIWNGPSYGQTRVYGIWRAQGRFPTLADVLANSNLFTQIGTVSGAPPSTTFTDTNTTFTTFTYFVTDTNKQGIQSSPCSPLVVTVVERTTSTAISGSPASTVFGQPVTLTATVTGSIGVPIGTVTFIIDGSPFGSAVTLNNAGVAVQQVSSLNAGSHAIVASYSGAADFTPSNSPTLNLNVGQASTTTTLSSTPANITYGLASAVLTATVAPVAPGAGTPTGSATFYDGANQLGTVQLSNGVASYSLTSVGAGNHTFNASYSGDNNFTGGNAPAYPLTIGKAAATVTLGNLNQTYDGTQKSATATTNPAGLTVNITYNGSPTAPTNAGSYAVVATISSPNYQGSANGTLTIAKGNSVTTITSNTPNPSVVGQTVTVSFTVVAAVGSSVPSGSVTVTASTGEACGPVTLASGAGSCSITFTSSGSRTLTATYSGDSNFLGSSSSGSGQPVGDFSISATPAAQTIPSGHQGYYTITLTPINGMTGTVALSCTGNPPNSTCTVSPSTANLQGSPVPSTVTLSANQNVNHGTFTLTFTGTLVGGSLTHSYTVQLTVK